MGFTPHLSQGWVTAGLWPYSSYIRVIVLHLHLVTSSGHNQSDFFVARCHITSFVQSVLSHPPFVCVAQLCFASLLTLFFRAPSLLCLTINFNYFTTRSSWFSGHELTPTSLGDRGLRFRSYNKKRLRNNFMLSAHAH